MRLEQELEGEKEEVAVMGWWVGRAGAVVLVGETGSCEMELEREAEAGEEKMERREKLVRMVGRCRRPRWTEVLGACILLVILVDMARPARWFVVCR